MQEKIWQPKDIIYAKDVLLFANPKNKNIELWVCGKKGFCKIESLDAKCEVCEKIPEKLKFLGRNLEKELYNKSIFNSKNFQYTIKDSDMMYLISKIRLLEFELTKQNFNKENFQKYLGYRQTKWVPSKPTFFECKNRPCSLRLQSMDWDVQVDTINMFWNCLENLRYGTVHSLKHGETQHYMTHIRSWQFFKDRIPKLENRNRFFTYYELLLYKEFLNINYTKKLYALFEYKDKLEEKLQSNKVAKKQQQKQKEEKENSKELYNF